MNTTIQSSSTQYQTAAPGWLLIFLLLALQIWSRYLPNPWSAFVADDWANWARSSFYDSHQEALLTGLQDPNRPLSMAAVEFLFRVFGDHALYWTLISITGNSLLLFMLLRMAWGLTGNRLVLLTTGVFYALFPNLTETFHWSTQVLNEVTCALMFYALSGWMWVDFARRGGGWRLFLSVAGYGIALFSYEAGVLLPGAYLVLLPWRKVPWRSLAQLLPFAAMALTYAAWRSSNSFGLNQAWHYPPHMEAGISVGGMMWNVRELLSWWLGPHLMESMRGGLNSFATLPGWTKIFLVLGNLLVVVAVGRWIREEGNPTPAAVPPFSMRHVALFGLAWTALSMAIPVLSYTAPRLNVLPALGISFLLALGVSSVSFRSWGLVLAIPAMLCMASNQGTTESYRQVDVLNRRLYAHLSQTVDVWKDKEVLLLDTAALRQRLTPGLITLPSEDQYTWAVYNNAPLLRGFVTRGMAQLALRERNPSVLVLHDVENGARSEGEMLHWHERYNAQLPQQNLLDRVYRIDAARYASPQSEQ